MQVRLIVPNGKYTTTESIACNPIDSYGKAIADIAGGFTATQGTGGWGDNQGNLIVEPVTVFDTTIESPANPNRESDTMSDLRGLATVIAIELNQESVYLSFDGRVEFVKP